MAIEIGDQTVASSPPVGAAVSRAPEEPDRRSVSEGAMFGSAAGRGRRSLWAILSLLFALGFAVSTTMVHSERNGALDTVVERARDEAKLAAATLTGKQLTKPVTGSSYDEVAAEIWRSVSSKGSIVGVTVWSSHGRILFSLNESLVGSAPAEMRSLIMGIAKGSGSARVLDDTVQTFTRVSKATDGPVAIVEVDQPLAVVEAQTGDLWSMLRLGSAFGLAVSLLLLGLTFVSSKGPVRAPEDDERARLDERQEGEEGAEMGAEGQQPGEQPPTEQRAPTYEEVFGLELDLDAGGLPRAPEDEGWPADEGAEMETQGQPPAEQLPAEERAPTSEEDVQALEADLDEAVDQVKALDADGESKESMRQWPEEFQDMFHDMAREGDSQTQEIRQRREEFKTRAKQAELRLKKLDAEPHEAPSAPNSER
ncbi:MAG: hypothetical protein L0206_19770 [Actinobacteria bacterium]|nr:hypothetical protein [Actinomycetota bacterium]